MLKMLTVVLIAISISFPANAFWGDKKKDGKEPKIEIEETSKDLEKNVKKEEKDIENKLLKLQTLEEAFLKALKKRTLLARFIRQERAKLKQTDEKEKKQEISQNIAKGQKQYKIFQTAMNVIFGIGNRRDYEYNQVTSTVYLTVGNMEQIFGRAIKAKQLLAQFIVKQKKALENAEDDDAKVAIQKKIDAGTKQFQTVAAAMQIIFDITSQRTYEYNPKNSTIYLKVSDAEVEKLKAQVKEMQEKQAAEVK